MVSLHSNISRLFLSNFSAAKLRLLTGNGPSALILSFILHGHSPRYVGTHPDILLHKKLSVRRDLLDVTPDIYEHFESSLRYSTQALPINTLLDTLIRPNADTDIGGPTCVQWGEAEKRLRAPISHAVLGDARVAGGQWADDPVGTNQVIGALSYAEQLSLPGYSYADHYSVVHNGRSMPEFQRPSREEVASYYAAYPVAVGINGAIYSSTRVELISRVYDGFVIRPQNIRCRHLVLATGVFSTPVPPPIRLRPLLSFNVPSEPLLVIGSGFSAADIIISSPPWRKILHVFRWDPEERPSPLKGCHHQAYPEYAATYRHMKHAVAASASATGKLKTPLSPSLRKRASPFFRDREWVTSYEGLPNAEIQSVEIVDDHTATVRIRLSTGKTIERKIGGLAYVVGRRGTLEYLEPTLLDEVLGPGRDDVAAEVDEDEVVRERSLVSGRTLRPKAEVDLEVAPSVFIVGSLAGDSLVRHAFGGCTYAAGRIVSQSRGASVKSRPWFTSSASSVVDCEETFTPPRTPPDSSRSSSCRASPQVQSGTASPSLRSVGSTHQDLHLDRRKLTRAFN